MEQKICCPKLEKKDWDRKTHTWKEKVFYKEHYRSIFYIPIGFGGIMGRAIPMLTEKGIFEENGLILCRNEGMWGGDAYIELKRGEPSLNTEAISGKFFGMYFEGGYKETGKHMQELMEYCRKNGMDVKEVLSYYATCPECIKKYGTAQTVLFARIG